MEPSSASVQPIHRLDCWNVLILDGSDVKAGFFQHNNHLTYTMIFKDLFLCYLKHNTHLNSLFLCDFSKLPGRPGWVFAGDAEADKPVVISSSGHTHYLIAYHETSCSVEDRVDFEAHYKTDCIGRIPLIRQSLSQPDRAVSSKGIYVPINYTFPLTTMTSLSPRKKSNWTKGSGSIPPLPEGITAIGASSASVADFDFKIKTRDSQCVVSGSSTSFMTGLACGPGIQATHIVPKSHWLAYPLAQDDYANNDYLLTVRTSKPADSEATSADADAAKTILKRRYTATWSLSNGISLRSDIRAVHDARLLAIHPKTHEVRLFAPIEWLLPYHGVKAKLPSLGGPDKRALKFHYDQCVLENVCAKTFDSNPPGIDELMRLPAIGELKRAGFMLKPVAGPRDLVLGPQRNGDGDDET